MSQQPNVIVFFTDQQRWDTSGLHGNPLNLMPNFDRLASYGTHIDASITCQPVCGPARSCLQTGLYATQTGVTWNFITLDPKLKTLAHYFNDAGYQTSYIGKWHLADRNCDGAVREEERGGYQQWLASNLLEFVSDAWDTVLYNNENEEVRLPGYRVDAMTDAAIRNIDAMNREGKPFFQFLSYLEPHHQNHIDDYPPPEGYREAYTGKWMPPDLQALGGSAPQHIGGYFGMVKRLDEALGRILDALKSLNILENTIILFTSDHGCHFKTRNDEYKRSCHEASVRVPTAFAGPGFQGGGRRSEVLSLVDLVPTLLDAAGIEIPDSLPGRSLLPILKGESTEWEDLAFIQISESQVGRAIRTGRWKYCVNAPNLGGKEAAGSDVYEEQYLYDLETDPYELQNLIQYQSHAGVCEILKEKLCQAMERAGERRPEIRSQPKELASQRVVTEAEMLS